MSISFVSYSLLKLNFISAESTSCWYGDSVSWSFSSSRKAISFFYIIWHHLSSLTLLLMSLIRVVSFSGLDHLTWGLSRPLHWLFPCQAHTFPVILMSLALSSLKSVQISPCSKFLPERAFKIASFFDSLYYICFIFIASIIIGHTSYCFLFASLFHNWILEFLFFRTVHLSHVQCLVFVLIQDKFLKYVKEFLIKNLNTWHLEEKLAN